MIKSEFLNKIKKVSLITYLFLFASLYASGSGISPSGFNDQEEKAYNLILSLRFDEALKLLQNDSPASLYLKSLSKSLELVISEDYSQYDNYEEEQEDRIAKIKKTKEKKAISQLLFGRNDNS